MVGEVELEKIAEIARLKLGEQERESLREDLETILEYFSSINRIEGLGKEKELLYPAGEKNELREDGVKECKGSEEIVGLFNKKEKRYMVAPKSLE
jgi:aspartyl-tRNA(Asn)/glutamyl-tRNA(Gln) amidotransferase subunit C